MDPNTINGFLKAASDFGLSKNESEELLKLANQDQQAAMAAGQDAQQAQLGAGQPPLPTEDAGIPPEVEELINSLPPEVLQQLMAEIEQELSGAAAGQEKQSADSTLLLSKTAEYVEGFFEAASEYGLTRAQARQCYKQAADYMEKNPINTALAIDSKEKQALHYEGFLLEAADHGFSVKQAEALYINTFLA